MLFLFMNVALSSTFPAGVALTDSVFLDLFRCCVADSSDRHGAAERGLNLFLGIRARDSSTYAAAICFLAFLGRHDEVGGVLAEASRSLSSIDYTALLALSNAMPNSVRTSGTGQYPVAPNASLGSGQTLPQHSNSLLLPPASDHSIPLLPYNPTAQSHFPTNHYFPHAPPVSNPKRTSPSVSLASRLPRPNPVAHGPVSSHPVAHGAMASHPITSNHRPRDSQRNVPYHATQAPPQQFSGKAVSQSKPSPHCPAAPNPKTSDLNPTREKYVGSQRAAESLAPVPVKSSVLLSEIQRLYRNDLRSIDSCHVANILISRYTQVILRFCAGSLLTDFCHRGVVLQSMWKPFFRRLFGQRGPVQGRACQSLHSYSRGRSTVVPVGHRHARVCREWKWRWCPADRRHHEKRKS